MKHGMIAKAEAYLIWHRFGAVSMVKFKITLNSIKIINRALVMQIWCKLILKNSTRIYMRIEMRKI